MCAAGLARLPAAVPRTSDFQCETVPRFGLGGYQYLELQAHASAAAAAELQEHGRPGVSRLRRRDGVHRRRRVRRDIARQLCRYRLQHLPGGARAHVASASWRRCLPVTETRRERSLCLQEAVWTDT